MTEQESLKSFFSHGIKENMDGLYGMARRLTRNDADAEDLLAESVTKAWSAIESLEDRQRFRPWVFRILHNCFISAYRKKAVRPKEQVYEEQFMNEMGDDLTELLVQQPNEFLDWWGNPEREFANTLLREDIMAAMDDLPESYRVTILLVNVEGLSYDEAADVLEIPPGTVRSRMKRGRTLLQKALWEHGQEAGLVNGKNINEYKS